jgi:hypothetical protein
VSESVAFVAAACVAGIASIIVGIIQMSISLKEMADKNNKDHVVVRERIDTLREDIHDIKNGVKSVNERIDEHVGWHLDHSENSK